MKQSECVQSSKQSPNSLVSHIYASGSSLGVPSYIDDEELKWTHMPQNRAKSDVVTKLEDLGPITC